MRKNFILLMILILAITLSFPFAKGEENWCDDLTGAAYGLCNVYCKAMDCVSDTHHSSDIACDKKYNKFVKIQGQAPPCEEVVEEEFAVDFGLAAPSQAAAFAEGTILNPVPSLTGKEFTIEAWVKRGSSTLTGGIFGRLDATGFVLFINNDVPKVGIKRTPITFTEPIGCVKLSVTSTECIVASSTSLVQDVWTHIAGVLTTEDQSSDQNCGAVGSQTPHLAIYIDGNLKNCGTTAQRFAENPILNSQLITIGVIGDGVVPKIDGGAIESDTPFTGTIDEVRYWHVARTQTEIQQCMNQKLGLQNPCNVNPSILIGYWRLNEGAGATINDVSGNGFFGTILLDGRFEWDGGWVSGY
jgi:hypothetical protein